ncbi:MAG: HTTM domain-containing protein [Deltaproteobacteria bacterium]|nr:HTTM domain-containing protein [Deltaproteobacteria bacterium]
MLNRIGDWVASRVHGRAPCTNVYGLARTLLALSTALTLVANDTRTLFVPLAGIAATPPFCQGHGAIGIFCLSPELELARWSAIAILLVVASGWRPRVTGVAHWWVAASLQWNASVLDGGDQVCMVLALLLLPLTVLDGRRWHWDPPAPMRSEAAALVGWSTWIAVRVQVAAVYYHAGVAKYGVDEWGDGTALWYWFRNPTFGAPEALQPIVQPVIASATALPLLTWSVLVLEFLLAGALWMPPGARRVLFPLGCALHVGIALVHGITSFALAMIAALLLYLHAPDRRLAMPRVLARARAWLRHPTRAPSVAGSVVTDVA